MDIIQYNIRGLQNNRNDIDLLKNLYDPTIFCLQETHIKLRNSPKFNQYKLIHNINDKATQGVAFLIKENTKFTEIPLNTNCQAIAIEIKIPYKVHICNIYIHPNDRINETELQNLIDQIPEPRILLGDFNAHSQLWGSLSTNKRGEIIENCITSNNLMCINNRSEFTYYHPSSGTGTKIDLTLCNLNIATKLTWRTLEQIQSDHIPILISTKNHSIPPTNSDDNINYSNMNWSNFKSTLESQPITQKHNNRDRIKFLTESIQSALQISQKTVKTHIKRSIPWWNITLNKLRNERNKALRRFHKYPTTSNRETFNECKRQFRAEIIKQKSLHWSKYINTINHATNSKEFWNQIKKVKGDKTYNSITALNIDGSVNSDPKVIANNLVKSFANSECEDYKKRRKQLLNFTEKTKSCPTLTVAQINQKITRIELERALLTTKNSSSPGIDSINYETIKNLPEHFIFEILDIYNSILSKGIYPKSWKIAKIIPILKKDSDQFEINSYRPISLLPCLSKLLEKILTKRLQYWITEEKLISPNQMGFQKDLSTTDALVKLTLETVNDTNNRNHTDCIALDLTKAFDKCWPETITSQLKKWGLSGNIFNLIKSFLEKRSMMIRTSTLSSKKEKVHFGVPQGSPISALLFTVAINGLSDALKKIKNVKHTLFADDIIIYSSFKKRKNCNIQKALNRTQKWCQSMGFEISSLKNQHIHFCRLKQCNSKTYNICNNNIETKPTIKYLGVTFDSKLNFMKHIEITKAKNLRNLNIIKILASPKNGVNAEQLIKISNTIIRPSIEYGCQIYSTASKSNLEKLNPIYNSAIRISIGALCTSPISSLHAEAHTYPLNDRFQELNAKYIFKVKSNSNHPNFTLLNTLQPNNNRLKSGLQKTIEFLLNNNIRTEDFQQKMATNFPPWHTNVVKTDTSLSQLISKSDHPNLINSQTLQFLNERYKTQLKIYTDGSKTSQSTAYGIYSDHLKLNIKVRINRESSIFEAESQAILSALELTDNNYDTIILTDSLSAVKAIQSFQQSNYTIQKIQNTLKEKTNIKIVWIPSHIGITGNENADRLANSAHLTPNKINKTISNIDAYRSLKHIMFINRQEMWNKSSDKLKNVKSSLKIDVKDKRQLNRSDEVFLTRVRIGHTIDSHSYYFSRTPRPGCVHCQVEYSVKHCILDCTLPARIKIRKDFKMNNYNLSEILNKETCNIEFLKLITNINSAL